MRKENEFTRVLRIAMMLALPLGLAACAPEEGQELEETPEAMTPESPTEAAPLSVDIASVESDVDGEATIARMGESLTVALNLENLPGEGPFQAHIHAGTCSPNAAAMGESVTGQQPTDEPSVSGVAQGEVLAPLEPVSAGTRMSGQEPATGTPAPTGQAPTTDTDDGNTGTSTSTVQISQLQGQQEAFIQVHGEGGAPIACGDIEELSRVTMGSPQGQD